MMRLLLLVAWLTFWPGVGRGETIHVAVTASFSGFMEYARPEFSARTGHTLVLSSGSSGKLYAQIVNGAPYQLFLAADETHPGLLVKAGLALPESRFIYATGRLALFGLDPDLARDAPRSLSAGTLKRIALANPDTAPFGRAAREVLTAMDLWSAFQGRMVIGENVGHVLAFVQSGAVEAGFVAFSQTLDKNRQPVPGGVWEPPSTWYAPLRQEGVILTRGEGSQAVRELVAFLTADWARGEMTRMGYGTAP